MYGTGLNGLRTLDHQKEKHGNHNQRGAVGEGLFSEYAPHVFSFLSFILSLQHNHRNIHDGVHHPCHVPLAIETKLGHLRSSFFGKSGLSYILSTPSITNRNSIILYA